MLAGYPERYAAHWKCSYGVEPHHSDFCCPDLHGWRALYIYQRALKKYRIHSLLRVSPDRRIVLNDLVRERRQRRVGWDGVSWQVALHPPELCWVVRVGASTFTHLAAVNSSIDPLDGLRLDAALHDRSITSACSGPESACLSSAACLQRSCRPAAETRSLGDSS